MKAGIIGFGYMGHFHLKASQAAGIDVISAYDIDESKLADAEAEGLTAFSELEAFLQDDISLVYICTPNHVHKELAVAALDAGKSVMCEKPVAMNLAELEEILAAADRSGKLFTVHQNRRWEADYLVVKNVVESSCIGAVTSIESKVFGQRGVCFGWRADPVQGGGMLYDWGIHLIDQFLCMFDDHKVVSVYAKLQSILTPAVDDSFELQMMFDNEITAKVNIGTFCLQPQPRWMVFGDRGTLKLDDFTGKAGNMARIKEGITGFDSVFGKHNIGPSRTMAPLHPDQIEQLDLPEVCSDKEAFHRNLKEAAEGSAEPYVTADQLRRSMKIVDLAFESSKLGQVIKTEI